jgi:hypothetical protein
MKGEESPQFLRWDTTLDKKKLGIPSEDLRFLSIH